VKFQEAVQNSSVVRGDHKDALLASLSKIPEFSWLVGQPNPHIDRLQGDFFNDFPALFLKPDGAVASKPRPVMVLNNTCDLPSGRSSMVSVAPLFDLEKYLQSQAGKRDAGSLANYERDIRHNNRRIASCTQSGFYLLLIKITYHFTRSESMEVSRT
jgi:hypothetical protein